MKIELSELPIIRELLEELQNNVWAAEQLARPIASRTPATEFKIEDREYNEMRTITLDELLGIFQNRVEAQTKYLRQRYQIDFIPSSAASLAPLVLDEAAFLGKPVDSDDGIDALIEA